jgi:hypothetical protein
MPAQSLLFFQAEYATNPENGGLVIKLPNCKPRNGVIRHAQARRALKHASAQGWLRGVCYFKTAGKRLVDNLEIKYLEITPKPDISALPVFHCVGNIKSRQGKHIGIYVQPNKALDFTVHIDDISPAFPTNQALIASGVIYHETVWLQTAKVW